MRFALFIACLALPAGALAQDSKPAESKPVETKEPDKPMTERSPSMGDAVATPASDLNLKKDTIPPLLLTAQDRPYTLVGLRRCPEIAAAVGELDAVLGPDIDLPAEARNGMTAGRVAQAAVGSFIPFRGLIREISGANEQERKIQAAVQAGMARRAYLKGVGEARGCRYPARAAGAAEIAALTAPPTQPEVKSEPKQPRKKRDKGVTYTSEAVVQPIKK
ncbi:MAG: hypothetical protein EBR34_10910 [Sphingomonadaceae bacterium]|nr:hypothetical protein [Sphingomonadaceae bacterium]